MVTSVPNGGALEIAPGMAVRVEVYDIDGPDPIFVDPADLDPSKFPIRKWLSPKYAK